MSDTHHSNNGKNSQSPFKIWDLLHSVVEGEQLFVNDITSELTVTAVKPNKSRGDLKEIHLVDNSAKRHVIVLSNDNPSTCVIQRESGGEVIESINPGSEHMLTTATAEDLYGEEISDHRLIVGDTYPESRENQLSLEEEEVVVIGNCPECQSVVIEKYDRAMCSECTNWCDIEMWKQYHNN